MNTPQSNRGPFVLHCAGKVPPVFWKHQGTFWKQNISSDSWDMVSIW